MINYSEYYRREALLVEEAAQYVTLLPDREELLAVARSLRQRAEALAVQSEAGHTPMIKGAPGDDLRRPRAAQSSVVRGVDAQALVRSGPPMSRAARAAAPAAKC